VKEMAKYFEGEYSTIEYMSIQVSREIRPDDKIFGPGFYNDFVYSGALLALRTTCPDVDFLIGAGWTSFAEGDLPRSTSVDMILDYRFIRISERTLKGHDLLQMCQPGPRPSCRVFFIGGLQIDKYGNTNNSYVGEDWRHPKFRGPGIIGQQTFSSFMRRYYVYTRAHTKRTFVDTVDFVTTMGYKNKHGTRKDFGLDKWNQGPHKVLTPLCWMDFEEESNHMRLASVHPGHTVEEVKGSTGFDLIIPEKVPTTEPPTEEEIRILRGEIDKKGVLRKEWGKT
jgi:glutaconate CoA-transferase subunit B